MHRPSRAVLSLPPDPTSAFHARRFVARTLRVWRLPALRETAALLVSELVGNAIRHAGTPVELVMSQDRGRIRVEVRDGTLDRPRPRLPDPDTETGRGLFLVDRLATDWGVREEAGGKTVWFVLDTPAARALSRVARAG